MKQRIFDYLAAIPAGKVVTYGQIADFLGNPKLARFVGNCLHKNPDGEVFPCYKVVSSKGKLSEHYAFGGLEAQKRRLMADGIEVQNNRVDLKKYRWDGFPCAGVSERLAINL